MSVWVAIIGKLEKLKNYFSMYHQISFADGVDFVGTFKWFAWEMTRVKACSIDALEVGGLMQLEIPERDPIAIYRLADGYYATDDYCTHGAAYLSEGDIEGDEIYCPFHAGAFDIKTGEPAAAPCVIPLKTYSVIVESGEVFIEF